MLINKDLTKSSRRQSLQLEKCTFNDPQPMMAIDGRGEVDVSWPRAIIWLHLLWKNWSNTVNQKRNCLRKSSRQILLYVERRDQLTFFQADPLFSCPGQLNRWPCHSLINQTFDFAPGLDWTYNFFVHVSPEHIHDRYLSQSVKETLNTRGQVDQSLICSSLHATLILHSEYSGNLKLEVVRSNIHAW